jgi:hypothetical protein
MKKMNRVIILKGEGVNEHVLEGNFTVESGTKGEMYVVDNKGLLVHQTPGGKFGDHHTLPIGKGKWVRGNQVEFNPMDDSISNIWD